MTDSLSSKDETAERYHCVGGSMYIYRDLLVNEPTLFVLHTDYDRMLRLGETYERDYRRLLDAGTKLRHENERLTSVVANLQGECERLMQELEQRSAPETPAEESDSGWYVEEWCGGDDWRRHAVAHIWEYAADAREQLDELMHRYQNTTFRLAQKTAISGAGTSRGVNGRADP